MDDALDVYVIEEALDVKKNDGGDKAAFNCSLGVVGEAKGGINSAVVVP